MARLMLSAGMFSALAAETAPRKRGFFSGSPPLFAAMVISFIRRVKILPRLASSAPFLCLMVAHFEWPDIREPRIFDEWDDYRTLPAIVRAGRSENQQISLRSPRRSGVSTEIGRNRAGNLRLYPAAQ